MILFINTADVKQIFLALIDEQGNFLIKKKITAGYKQAEKLLPAIDKLLGRKSRALAGIIVVKGPGSFTSLRVGVTVANTLAFALCLPVAGVIDGEREEMIRQGLVVLKKNSSKVDKSYVVPEYGREPNITMGKP